MLKLRSIMFLHLSIVLSHLNGARTLKDARDKTKTPFLILLLLSLASCNNLKRLINGSDSPSNSQESSMVVLAAGQSNMERMNLSEGFASEMRSDGFLNICPTNVAVGGTSLSQWEKGGNLYSRLLLQRNPSALIFWQGENEGLPRGEDPTTWRVRFEGLIDNVRTDLGIPNLPVVFVQIGINSGYGEPWEEVKRQQASVVKDNVYMVISDDVPQDFDGLHYTPEAYNLMGRRIADKLAQVL